MPVDEPVHLTQRCFACGDIGFTVEKDGTVRECWRRRAGAEHNSPAPAALILRRSVENLRRRRVTVDPHVFLVASRLAKHTAERPAERDRILENWFGRTHSPLRAFHKVIETLRAEWLLPVASRKSHPAGYWICSELDDFAEWVGRCKSAPITQLTTIHRVARANFPVFAEQLELEFWADLKAEDVEVSANV